MGISGAGHELLHAGMHDLQSTQDLSPVTGGLLQPLPMPTRPWSHISLDFITGLPCSEENFAILTIIDHFSKMAHFISLPKLPSARETAQLLVCCVVSCEPSSWSCLLPWVEYALSSSATGTSPFKSVYIVSNACCFLPFRPSLQSALSLRGGDLSRLLVITTAS